MKFSRFELAVISLLVFVVVLSTAVSVVFSSQAIEADELIRSIYDEPASAQEADLGLPAIEEAPLPVVKKIDVNLSEQKMYAYENDALVYEFVISSGKPRTPTPEGEFYINNKIELAYSRVYRLYMPNWQAFIGSKYGIHGLPFTKRGKRITWIEGINHLGFPVSHGCIRLSWEDAATLYSWTEIGTPIYIHN